LGILVLFGLFTLSLAAFPVTVLVNRYIGFIGKVSFSMYLTHFAVIYGLSRLGFTNVFRPGDASSALYVLCVLTVTVAISWASYSFIENPGIALGKAIIRRLESSALRAERGSLSSPGG